MKSKIKSLVKISATIAVLCFLLLYYLKKPSSINECWDLILEATGYSTLFIIFYEKILWRFNPLVKIPKLKKEYIGKLSYNFQGVSGEKSIEIFVEQTFLTVKIKLITDEIQSNTITSELLEENGQYVIYYTYITNPYSKYSEGNPIQIGSCKLIINNSKSLNGIYWTSRKTIGDVNLNSKK